MKEFDNPLYQDREFRSACTLLQERATEIVNRWENDNLGKRPQIGNNEVEIIAAQAYAALGLFTVLAAPKWIEVQLERMEADYNLCNVSVPYRNILNQNSARIDEIIRRAHEFFAGTEMKLGKLG